MKTMRKKSGAKPGVERIFRFFAQICWAACAISLIALIPTLVKIIISLVNKSMDEADGLLVTYFPIMLGCFFGTMLEGAILEGIAHILELMDNIAVNAHSTAVSAMQIAQDVRAALISDMQSQGQQIPAVDEMPDSKTRPEE